ncbi:MAG: copper chaperone [Thiobacillus sp.]|nr:copper chaperone [Thiobacillus sp.]
MNIVLIASRNLTALILLFLILGTPLNSSLAAEKNTTYAFQADGLACPFCAYGIEKQVLKLKGVVAVNTDVASGKVVITVRKGATLDEAQVDDAVKRAGFTMRAFQKE